MFSGNKRQMSASQNIWPIVIAWGDGQLPSESQQQQLIAWEIANAKGGWPIAPAQLAADNAQAMIVEQLNQRASLLQSTAQLLEREGAASTILSGHWSDWIVPLWRLWLPLAQQLDSQQKTLGAPFIQGILGGQGVGKTTLTKILQLILKSLGHRMAVLSVDDLYLTYAQRQVLQQQDPRLIWRGPPGTHDVELGMKTLRDIKEAAAGEQVSVPQFDKSLYGGQGDRIPPFTMPAPTILLFEGWLVGTRPVADTLFTKEPTALPAPILTSADCAFALDSNRRLQDYLPLWSLLDSLIVLNPVDYRLSQRWRQEAERSMKATGRAGLSDPEIADFVVYFWKALHPELFITPLTCQTQTSLVVTIRSDHTVGDIYSPAFGQHT